MALLLKRIRLRLNCASRVLRWVPGLLSLAQERSLQSPGTRDCRVPDERALASEDPGPRGHAATEGIDPTAVSNASLPSHHSGGSRLSLPIDLIPLQRNRLGLARGQLLG